MLRILSANSFEQRQRFRGSFLPKQALAKMRARVDVLGVAFQRGPVACFSLLEFALLKVDIAQLRMMMRFIQMMDLGLQFFDPFAIVRPGKFETAHGRWRAAVNVKDIPECSDAG